MSIIHQSNLSDIYIHIAAQNRQQHCRPCLLLSARPPALSTNPTPMTESLTMRDCRGKTSMHAIQRHWDGGDGSRSRQQAYVKGGQRISIHSRATTAWARDRLGSSVQVRGGGRGVGGERRDTTVPSYHGTSGSQRQSCIVHLLKYTHILALESID